MLTPLLTTKLFFPPSRSKMVHRPRLVERLNDGLRGPLTLVSAPAGYGKTSLLSEWRSSDVGRGFPMAWLSLDPDDNEPTRFLAYLIAAIRGIQPGFGEITLVSLQAPQPPPPPVILANLINELSELAGSFALALDDYHVITTQPIHEALSFILDHLPAHMHLVILSRADPPLPLARLRARNQVIEIRATDLRFTPAEAGKFLRYVMGLALSTEDIEILGRRTEGWIAGLQLAALSLQGQDDPAQFIGSFGGSNYYIVDYLVEEVLNRQSESSRLFLLQTSILDRLTGPLCDAVTGQTGGQVTLENFEHANLFVTLMGGERKWYRYHPLFADVMQNRLRQLYPGMVDELHARASGWFEQNQNIGEAIRHALAANDRDHAARLVEQNAMHMLMQGELATLLNWIKAIEPVAYKRPWLNIYQSWALTLTGQLDQAGSWLQNAEKIIPAHESAGEVEEMLGHIAAIRAYQSAQRGETSLAINFAGQALEHLPESNQAVRSVVTMTLGSSRRLRGDLEGAARALEEAVRSGKSAGNFYLALGALSGLADLFYDQGKLDQASCSYGEILQWATRPDGEYFPAAGMAFFGLALICYEKNDVEAALQHTLQAIELCRKWGNVVILMGSYVMLFRIKQAQGEIESARAAFGEAERLARENPTAPRAASLVESFRARSWLAQGDIDAAERWVVNRVLAIDDEFSYLREPEYLALIRIFLAQNNFEAALALSERMRNSAEAIGRRGSVIEILVLHALTFQEMGDHSQALAVMERALSLAEPESYQRVFLDEGAPMAELLRHAGSKGIAPKYVSKLLAEYNKNAGLAPFEQQPLIEPLSERELEVVRLIAAGKSNQEIAAELVLSIGTVKAHLSHIYHKLNVVSRTQCIARVRDLNLLS